MVLDCRQQAIGGASSPVGEACGHPRGGWILAPLTFAVGPRECHRSRVALRGRPWRSPGLAAGEVSQAFFGRAIGAGNATRSARPRTNASATFMRARRTMRSKVWRETFMRAAASVW